MELDRQNEAWKKVEGYLKQCIVFSFLLAAVAYGFVVLTPEWAQAWVNIFSGFLGTPRIYTMGVTRAIIYFTIGYVTIVPIYFVRAMATMWGVRVVKGIGLARKLFLSMVILFLVPMSLVFPFEFILSGRDHYWRLAAIYDLTTKSFFGLSILGGAALWVEVLCLMAFLGFIPLIWIDHFTKGDSK